MVTVKVESSVAFSVPCSLATADIIGDANGGDEAFETAKEVYSAHHEPWKWKWAPVIWRLS